LVRFSISRIRSSFSAAFAGLLFVTQFETAVLAIYCEIGVSIVICLSALSARGKAT
jgi:hypothetical protein